MRSLRELIRSFSWDASFDKMAQAMTGRVTPQARPRAILAGTKT